VESYSYVEAVVKSWRASELEELIFNHVIYRPKQIPSAMVFSKNGLRICPVSYKHPGSLPMQSIYDWRMFVCFFWKVTSSLHSHVLEQVPCKFELVRQTQAQPVTKKSITKSRVSEVQSSENVKLGFHRCFSEYRFPDRDAWYASSIKSPPTSRVQSGS